MLLPDSNHVVTIALMLMLSIASGSQCWGSERLGFVESVEAEQDATVQKRPSKHDEWLHTPKNKNILSADTIHTRKAKVAIQLDEDGSTWQLFQHVIACFTKQPSQCAADPSQPGEHVVVVEGKRGYIQRRIPQGEPRPAFFTSSVVVDGKVVQRAEDRGSGEAIAPSTEGQGGQTTKDRSNGGEMRSEAHTANAVICGACPYNFLFNPQTNTTVVTCFEECIVRVRNPQAPDQRWIECRPNEPVLIVGILPPSKPKELQDSDVLLSALTTMPLPDAPGLPLTPPGMPDHHRDSTPDPPWFQTFTRDVNVIVTIP
jgi:hypothetical protein